MEKEIKKLKSEIWWSDFIVKVGVPTLSILFFFLIVGLKSL